MFSGIVETQSTIAAARKGSETIAIDIKKPSNFEDLKAGDSIAVDGVCLTLEVFNDQIMTFTLGPETIRVTGWTLERVQTRAVNLERSLRLQDRIHGHLVTGHVDATAAVREAKWEGETLRLEIEIPQALSPFIWPKGSVAVNGVSLTVNKVANERFSVGLIPETLKRTNLKTLKAGDRVNLEADNIARGLFHFAEFSNSVEYRAGSAERNL
jgi:riboflavin synthase